MSILFKWKPVVRKPFLNFCSTYYSNVLTSNTNFVLRRHISKKMECRFEVLPTPIKSESDKKEYKVIKLKNGLTACLISDKSPITEGSDLNESDVEMESESESETSSAGGSSLDSDTSGIEKNAMKKGFEQDQKLAAAGLCIGVGSFHDPPEVPGMAHFLEHMVFMGSEKFPMENDFDSFIKKSGGSDNASTDTETTCFYFEIVEKHLLTALDKFAQFFISPLMKKEAISREREAIDSEFEIALPSDSSRKEQLLNSLAQQDSPVNSFPWGNLETLRDNITDDKLYQGVHEFRKIHYSAHRMTLAIQARLPIETLESYVLDCFEKVPNNAIPKPDLTHYSKTVYDTPEFKRIFYIKPTKDLCQVDLIWALPSLQKKYRSKPAEYIAFLLGDEGKGSILSYLRKKVWVLGTAVGNGSSGVEDNSIHSFFTVSLVTTEEGMNHLFEIINVVFAYINMLKKIGPQKRIFDELQTLWHTSFKYTTEEPAVDFVEELSEAMQVFPPEHYICGQELLFDYDPQAIQETLNLMTADRMCIFVMSNKFPNNISLNKTEKWFGTNYSDMDIPQELINQWNKMEPMPELNLPDPNKFLTTDFTILPPLVSNPNYPTVILKNPSVELWYRKDDKFNLPRAYYYLYLISPIANSASSHCMLDMLYHLLELEVGEELYPAVSADLSYKFASYERSLLMKVSGFNEKLPILLDVLTKHMKTISTNIRPDLFEAVKKKLINNYHNKLIKPYDLAKDIRLNNLVNNHSGPMERYEASLSLNFDDMVQFSKDYFKKLYVKALVQGNVSQDLAKTTIENVIKELNYEPLPKEEIPIYQVVKLPLGERCCRVQSLNKNDSNSVITNYYQSGPITLADNVLLELIMLAIEEPLFDTLRTKEQLGYNVSCSIRDTFGILGYTITVNTQASKFTTQHVDKRIETFVKSSHKIFKSMKPDELEALKTVLIKIKQSVEVHLKEEVDRNWAEIIDNEYVFDRLKKEVGLIETISGPTIIKWWNDHNQSGNKSNFRKLAIQVVGHKPKKATNKKPKVEEKQESGDTYRKLSLVMLGTDQDAVNEKKDKNYFIKDIQLFKNDMEMYPKRVQDDILK